MQINHGIDKKIRQYSRRTTAFLVPTLASLLIFSSGCSTTTIKRITDGVQPVLPAGTDPERQARVYQEISLSERERQQAHVQIIGGDVELPPSASADKAAEQRTYDFYVWISAPSIIDLKDSLQSGELSIDVLNTKAKIEEVKYGSFRAQDVTGSGILLDELKSGKVVRVSVNSRDITQSFTIVVGLSALAAEYEDERKADFERIKIKYSEAHQLCEKNPKCKKMMRQELSFDRDDKNRTDIDNQLYERYITAAKKMEQHIQEENPYLATKVVRVFNGDLHTQVYMLSDAETRDAFGSNFARHFYVGKAYFRNRHSDMKLIVNTTSLRAKTLFYRAPSRSGSGKTAERYAYLDYYADDRKKIDPYLTVAQKDRIYRRVMQQEIRIQPSHQDELIAEQIATETIKSQTVASLGGEDKKFLLNEIRIIVLDLRRAVRNTETECGVNHKDRENIYRSISEIDHQIIRAFAEEKKQTRNDAYEAQKKCVSSRLAMRLETINSRTQTPSPITLDGRRRVGLTDKVAASSQDVYWQLELNRSGYVWEDYYRPMTLEAVLISLAAKTRSHPNNRAIDYLQSLGVVAGALVGLDQISSVFGGEAFAQRVAVTTGVFMPEVRKLLMRDLDQYLANLASTALPSILSLGPNESRDGYVFFPRGPIYGYGVDEFSLEDPSYIRNVDNDDVAVDGALIEAEKQFSAGQKSAEALVGVARSQGQTRVADEMLKLADLEGKYQALRVRNLVNEVCEMIADSKGPAAAAYVKSLSFPEKQSQTIIDLIKRSEANIGCDKPLLMPASGT